MTNLHDHGDMEGMSDEQIVWLARDGSEEAFVVLMHRCAGIIQQQASRYRQAWLDVEDLAQEGLMGLYSAVRSFQSDKGASFRTYATVCIRHRMLSAAKRLYASRDVPQSALDSLQEEEGELAIEDGQADPAQVVLRREDVALLHRQLQETLTPLEYDVLMLYLGAYTYEEIGRRLHIQTKAVDNALQRVRRKLAAEQRPGE